jgi:hypothetical protein
VKPGPSVKEVLMLATVIEHAGRHHAGRATATEGG